MKKQEKSLRKAQQSLPIEKRGKRIRPLRQGEPMNEQTESTTRQEEIPNITVCHLFPLQGLFSRCGVPRIEQPVHGKPGHHLADETFCSTCGNRRCEVCAALSPNRNRRTP